MAPAIGRHHAEWLSLVETSGPFLSVPVLSKALPQGLDAPDRDVTARLRSAREQLDDEPSLQRSWCEFVLREVLDLDDALAVGAQIPAGQEHRVPEHGDTVRPDFVVIDHAGGAPKPTMHVAIHEPTQRLDRRIADAAWSASPIDRLAALCRATGVPLGLATNGQSWALVSARPGETTGACTWDADLWLEEPITLRAFRTLLGAHRFFSVAEDDTLPSLLEESAKNQQEVTDRLGAQVRQAVELLIDALDRADHDRKGELLAEIPNEELYRAAVTMMMRLVFLFVAEERRLLPLDDPLYAESYAASTLREQLEERAVKFGEDPLERSSAAWYRLLALSRAVHGGIDHEALRLPAYGGGLFDPNRYPFLEGRREGTDWRNDAAAPLPVDDRTVLHLLTALQVLTEPGRGGQPPTSVRLSFRALDVEQIGHVYEGLLDHTAVRTFDAALGLVGPSEEEIALGELETLREQGSDVLAQRLVQLKVKTGERAVLKALDSEPDADRVARLLVACDNDAELRDRVLPFLGIARDDLRAYPRVFLPGSLYVTKTLERRSSGTYYTPRSLAEEVVQHSLDAVAYFPGPAEDADPANWMLKSSDELLELKVADIAMGSGAFLVAACRYLAQRILEAWELEHLPVESDNADVAAALRDRLPADPLEREVLAHRLIAERCLYGIDKNPMAVEMAKLSLWLVTLAKDRPFSFLDHALGEGDSLLGVTSLDQVRTVHVDPARGRALHENLLGYTRAVGPAVNRALLLRDELESFVVRDVRDAQRKADLNAAATAALADVRLLGDVVVGAALANEDGENLDAALASIETHVQQLLAEDAGDEPRAIARRALVHASQRWVQGARVDASVERRCFHWALELPEVWRRGGFDAIVGNPPFQGGQKITGALGARYREFLVAWLAEGRRGSADLVAYFLLRATRALHTGGVVGLLATNTIGQGDTREVGLDALVADGYVIARAVSSEPWPGGANLEVSHLWLRRGTWDGQVMLDRRPVPGITASLEAASRVAGTPARLAANSGRSFIGSYVSGSGFLLTPREAASLIEADERNADVVRPYLSGADVNSRPDCSPSRWIVDFRDWPIERASEYPEPFAIVERLVRPERAKNKDRRRREIWWQFTRPALGLYRAIACLDRVLSRALTSKHHSIVFVPTDIVIDQTAPVLLYAGWGPFGLIQSGIHSVWAAQQGSTLETRERYIITDCFETFAQPALTPAVEEAGRALDALRSALMLDRNEGLTVTCNRLHSSDEQDGEICRLREIQTELDFAVRDAYGWTDLDLGHDFHETRQGMRFTFELSVRLEILDRLLELNLERRAVEDATGLHAKKKAARKSPVRSSARQTTMFGND